MNRMKLLLYAVCFTALVGCSPKYGVGDYYEAEGVRGVVFSVTDGGRHGKILSLEETSLPWQTGRGIDVVGAADRENGAVNLEQVKSQDNWQERFPAFAWCAGLGEGWYLPAVNEMAEINASHEAVNAALVAVQGTPLETQGVTFLYPDITPFQEAVAPMHQEMLENYPDLAPIYELIQAHNAEYPADSQ